MQKGSVSGCSTSQAEVTPRGSLPFLTVSMIAWCALTDGAVTVLAGEPQSAVGTRYLRRLQHCVFSPHLSDALVRVTMIKLPAASVHLIWPCIARNQAAGPAPAGGAAISDADLDRLFDSGNGEDFMLDGSDEDFMDFVASLAGHEVRLPQARFLYARQVCIEEQVGKASACFASSSWKLRS